MTERAGAPGARSPVLVVAADLATRRALARGLATELDVHVAEDVETARDLLRAQRFDVAVVDATRVAELAEDLAEHGAIAIGLGAPAEAPGALAAGAFAVVPAAPLSLDWLRAAVGRGAALASAGRRVSAQQASVEVDTSLFALVAESPGMRVVARTLRRAASTASNVMILGEPGSGASLIARRLHASGPRAERGAREVPAADLAERALAGAEGGEDLILDGVHELDPAGQRALIALLRDRDRAPAASRSRLIVTAHPQLRELARKGAFDRDLFHALAAVLIEIPPLRQREDDMPLLAHLLLARSAARLGRPEVRRVGTEALRVLRGRSWPGNVSELAEVLDRAVLEARGEVLLASHLPFVTGPRSPTARREAEDLAALVTADWLDLPHAEAKERVVSAFDRAYAEALLRRADGNTTQAARAAGMDRSNFKRLLRRARDAQAKATATGPSAARSSGRQPGSASSRRKASATEIDGLARDKK